MNLRGYGVLNEVVQKLIGVEHVPRAGVVDFEVQVGCRRSTRITAEGDELALAHGYVERRQTGIGLAGAVTVLILTKGTLDTRRE